MKLIALTKGYYAQVDDEDFSTLSRHKWYARTQVFSKTGRVSVYAARRDHGRYVSMHQVILGIKNVDHEDGDGLNNQRYNLRPCTNSQNIANQEPRGGKYSRYKGVTFSLRDKKWIAQITANNTHRFIGLFKEQADAAQAYNLAAFEVFGDFARLNQTVPR